MLPDRRMPEDEVCPVRDELLGELYCAAEHGVSDLVASVAPDIRTSAHEGSGHFSNDLVRWGGHVGAFLFARSREAPPPASVASVFGTRRTITLATGPLRKMLPIDDEPDEEDCEPV
jgi:hypothetical protein